MTDDFCSMESRTAADDRCTCPAPTPTPSPLQTHAQATSCQVVCRLLAERSKKGGNTPAWEKKTKQFLLTGGFKPAGQGEKAKGLVCRLDDQMIRWSIIRLFGVIFSKIQDSPAAVHFVWESKRHSRSLQGDCHKCKLPEHQLFFLITHDLW